MSELIEREELLFNAKINNRVRYVGVSATECVECGEEIPEARRVALPGIKTCVDCALC
tara:strand:+ start:7016 stop:7189 length:174 start_codon:yes stop_codon:yes gene_type:complete